LANIIKSANYSAFYAKLTEIKS